MKNEDENGFLVLMLLTGFLFFLTWAQNYFYYKSTKEVITDNLYVCVDSEDLMNAKGEQ